MSTLPTITPEVIKRYHTEIANSASPATIKRKQISLNKFFGWAESEGHVQVNPIGSQTQDNPFVISKPKKKIDFRPWAIVGITGGLVVLTFLLTQKLELPIPFIKSRAQESSVQTGQALPQSPIPEATIPANFAGNGVWNLYAKLKLSDENGEPQVGSQTLTFKLFDSEVGGTPIWTSDPKNVTTDNSGSALISLDGVPTDLFFQNNDLFLEPTGSSSSATVRIPIPTASNPAINSQGNLVLAGASPSITAADGNFLIEGQTVTIKTTDGSGGNIEINPDAQGIAHFLFEGSKGNFLNAQGPNLTNGSLYYGMVPNNATGYDLIKLQSGSPVMATRFSVDALGNTNMTGNLSTSGVTRLTSSGALQNITGYSQNSGNFTINQSGGDFASITKNSTALSDVLALTLDERPKPQNSNTDYSTLVLKRYDGTQNAYALFVDEGNARFDGQLQLGRFNSTPTSIGQASVIYNTTDNLIYYYDGSAWQSLGTAVTTPFSLISSGTNTTAAMVVGNGATLTYSGTGTINASSLNTFTSDQFLRSDTSDNYTSGTLTTDAGTILDINGDLTVSDANIAFDAANTTFTTTGNLALALGSGILDISAQTTDVTLNDVADAINFDSNTLSIDALNERVGIGTAAPSGIFHVLSAETTSRSYFDDSNSAGRHILTVQNSAASGGKLSLRSYGSGFSEVLLGNDMASDVGLFGESGGGHFVIGTLGTSGSRSVILGASNSEIMRLDGPTGFIGIGTTAPDAALEINHATGDNLRLTYNDSNGSATEYADFAMSATGDLTIDNLGSGTTDQLVLADTDTINIGGNGSNDIAYNAIADSVAGASASMNSDDDLYIEGDLEVDGTIYGAVVGTVPWSEIDNPTGDLTLAMSTWNTTFNWVPVADTAEANLSLTTQGADAVAGGEVDQTLLSLSQASNGVDTDQAADSLLTFANNDLNDPVTNAIRFDAGAAGTDFTYGINFDAASIGTAELLLSNAATIGNTVDGTLALTEPTIQLVGSTAIDIDSPTIDLSTQTTDVTLNNAVDALNFDSDTLSIDASSNFVGIGTAAPGQKLDVAARARFRSDGTNSSGFWLTDSAGTENVFVGQQATTATGNFGVWSNNAWQFTIANAGNVGINDISPDAKLEVLGTTEQLRLTNVDGTTDARFTVSATGDLTLDLLGSGTTDQLVLADTDTINIGGNGSTDVAYNVIGDSTTGAANVDSDDDLYIEGNLEVDGTIYGSLSGSITCTDCIDAAQLADTINFDTASETSFTLQANNATTQNVFTLTTDGLTSGVGTTFDLTATGVTTAFSGDLVKLNQTQTYTGGAGTQSGNVLDIARSITRDITTAGDLALSGALATISDTAATSGAGTGTLTHSADVLRIAQSYTSNTGSALNVTSAGGATGFALRVNDDGTFTDITPFVINNSGNVGIGTTSPTQKLSVAGQGVFISNVVNFDPGDAAGPAIRIGFNSTGDYGYINANDTGVASKNLVLQPNVNQGNVGIGDTGPDAKLEILGTTEQLRLTNVDGTTDARFTVSSTGDLTIDMLGSGTTDQLVLADTDTINIGGNGSNDIAYNAIADSVAGASASMNSDDDLYIEGDLEVDGTIYGTVVGTVPWSEIDAPTADLTLAHSTWNTTFNWDPGADSAETNFSLTTQGEDTVGVDEDQVLIALIQTSNGVDVTEAADALLTFTNNDADDPVQNGIRFNAGAAGTDFTNGINFNGVTFGTAELQLSNLATIKNIVDGTLALTEPTIQLIGSTSVDIDSPIIDLSTQTTDVTLNNAVDALNFDSNTLSIDALNNRVGIGTVAPVEILDIQSNSDADLSLTTAVAAGGDNSAINLRYARGTLTLPTVVSSGDALGEIRSVGYDGNSYEYAGRILFSVDGTPGDGDMPGRITFHTTPDGSSTMAERMRIDNAGNVGIGDTSPDALLEVLGTTEQLRLTNVDGTTDARFTVSSTGDLTIDMLGSGTTDQLVLADTDTINIGGNGSNDIAYNAIADSVAGASASMNSDDDLYIEGDLEVDGTIYGAVVGSASWSGLTVPTGDLTLAMSTWNTTFNWDPGADSAETNFSLTTQGEDTVAGGEVDQVLLALSQTSNGADVDQAADSLLTLANNDANDPVTSAIRFDAGAAGTDFTYGINFDAASIGTAELLFSNAATIGNTVDGTLALTEPTIQLIGSTSVDFDTPLLDLSTQTVDVTLNNAVDALNFDSNTLSIDASANRVGIGTAGPVSPLSVVYTSTDTHTNTNATGLTLENDQVGVASIINFRATNATSNTGNVAKIGALNVGGAGLYEGNLVFSLRTGSSMTERMRIDNAGNVGIGDTGPDAFLEVLGTTEQLRLTHTDGTTDSRFTVSSTGDLTIDNLGSGTTDQLILADTDTINIGGNGSNDIAYNAIADSVAGASASMNSDDDLYIEGDLEVDGTIYGTITGTIPWSEIDTPTADLTLAHSTWNTTFNWVPVADTAETNFSLTTQGADAVAGGEVDQVLLALSQTSNGVDTDQATDSLLTFANNDANDPVTSAIRFDAGAAGTDFTYGINFDASSIGTAELILSNSATIGNIVDGTLALTEPTIQLIGSTSVDIDSPLVDLGTQTVDVTLNNAIDALNFDGNTLSIDAFNNRVGIGDASPDYTLDITGNARFTTGLGLGGEGIPSSENLLYARNSYTGTGEATGLYGFRYQTANANANSIIAVKGEASGYNLGANTLTRAIGVQGKAYQTGTGTVTNAVALYAVAPSGTVVNAYGLYLDSVTAGSSTNYAIYSAGGINYFGGNVGIGTTAPDAALEINHATGDSLRLTYNDSDGSATEYADFAMSATGDLTITPQGNFTVTTDGTGNGEVVLSNDAIGPDEVLSAGQVDEYCLKYESTGDTWAWGTCSAGGGSWDTITSPTTADTTLTMGAWNTTFNWDPGPDSAETNFSLTTQGEDTVGVDEDQVLLALSQTANGVDVTQAADALLTFANVDADDPVINAIRFDAGGAGTDFTYGINFDAASFGTAEIVLSNAETISNLVDGIIALSGDLAINADDLTTDQTIFNLVNTTATTLNLGGAATTFNIGPAGGGASTMALSGGSADTGCTLDGATGNFTCSGNITSTATSGTQGWWQLLNKVLSPGNSTYDVAVGGDATTSAKFQAYGVETTAGKIASLTSSVITSGDVLSATASAITSGNLLKLGEGGNQTFSGNAIFADIDNTGGGGGAFTGNFLKFNNANSTKFTVDFAGNVNGAGIIAHDLDLSGSSVNILSAYKGFDGYTDFTGGIGTGGNGKDSITNAQRITSTGNMVNIGSYQGGQMLLTKAGTYVSNVDYATGTVPTGVAVGDVNGDGKADLAVASDTAASVFMNNGDGTFAAKVDYTTGTGPFAIAIGDLNGDGKADLAVTNSSSASVSIFINNGNGTFAARVDYTAGSSPEGIAIGDLNGDGKADLAVTNTLSSNISVYLNRGNGTFAARVNYTAESRPFQIAIGDVSGDGMADLAVTNFLTDNVSVFINIGSGTFAGRTNYTTGTTPEGLAMGDVSGDGKADLAVANLTTSNVSVFINSGTGTFAAKVDYAATDSPVGLAIGDVNGDGEADLAVANSAGTTASVFINNGDGTFATKADYTTGSGPYFIAMGDVNGDGKADLATTHFTTSAFVSVLMNTPATMFFAQASTGNIGINSAGPDRKLDVLDAASPQLRLTQADNTVYADFQVNSSGDLVVGVDGTTNQLVLDNGSGIGIGTAGPDSRLDILDASAAQLRLTQADGTVYGTFQVDSSGYLLIDPTGSRTALDGSLQVGSATSPLAYSRFGTATTGHGFTTSDDLLIGSDLELNGVLYLDGSNISNSSGTATILFSGSPTTTSSSLTAGNWTIDNTANVGQAALIVDQNKAGDLFTASSAGTPRFTIANNGTTTITTTNAITVASLIVNDNGGTGTGKIDVGTVDPPYTINGKKFATFMAGMIGIKEEVTGSVNTDQYVEGLGYRHVIDFNNLAEGSDLWLFGKTTNIIENIDKLVALLTPSNPTSVWYEVDRTNGRLIVYSARPTTISYRLTGPRFDYANWTNARNENDPTVGFVINNPNKEVPIDETYDIKSISEYILEKAVNNTGEVFYKLKNTSNEVVDGITSIGSLVAGNIRAGALTAYEVFAPKITTSLISPVPGSDLAVELPQDSRFKIQDENQNEVASVDSAGNATFSGELYATNVHSQNLDEIQALLNEVQADQSILSDVVNSNIFTATDSAQLNTLALSDLYVTNQAAVNSLSVTKTITIGSDLMFGSESQMINGNWQIENSLNSLSAPLKIQSLAMAPVEIMAGLVTIDTHGNVNITGNLFVAGEITTQKGFVVQGIENQDKLAEINASGSANFNDLTINGLIIGSQSDASQSGEVQSGDITTNATVGKAIIPSGVSEITVTNPNVNDYTLIYVTPTSSTDNYVLYVKSKTAGQFVVGFTNPLDIDVNFNWWIVQVSP